MGYHSVCVYNIDNVGGVYIYVSKRFKQVLEVVTATIRLMSRSTLFHLPLLMQYVQFIFDMFSVWYAACLRFQEYHHAKCVSEIGRIHDDNRFLGNVWYKVCDFRILMSADWASLNGCQILRNIFFRSLALYTSFFLNLLSLAVKLWWNNKWLWYVRYLRYSFFV